MRRRSRGARPQRALGLFVVFAAISLVPVLVLGLVLAASYRSAASARGLAEARTQAGLVGRTSVEPRLDGVDLGRPLSTEQAAGLDQVTRAAVAAGDIVRLRVRSLSGRVVYASDRSESDEVDDEALEAAEGRTVAEITHLNDDDDVADVDGDGASERGIRVAEVYMPLTDGRSTRPVGVLELYLPYDPIARDISGALHSLYRDLAIGLALLYVVLAGICWSVTGRLRRLAARNGRLASYDQLTGLPNRRSWEGEVADALRVGERHDRRTVVAVLDVDRFQEVNDTLGHGNGDALLVEVGRRLHAVAGERDVLARWGGDDFAVLFDSPDPAVVEATVAAMQDALRKPVDLAGIPVEVEITAGLAEAPLHGQSVETIVRHADVALNLAKQRGLRVAHYDPAADPYDPERLALVADLRRAIELDELTLHLQPKLDIETGVVDTVEALLRWNHPERGLLMPDEFIPVVEQTGMIDPMTAWVLDAAVTWVATAREVSPAMRVAVNVSARNLVHADFPAQVTAALERHVCSADALAIEVTETALVTDPLRAEASLRRLAATGVRISVDDFGRGQTSLSQLASMPLDEVKIDKGFVMDMEENQAHAAIARTVIDLGHRLGLRVVAEGVETRAVLDALRLAGCDIAQGYLIARPMPATAFRAWLAGHDRNDFTPDGSVMSVDGRHRRDGVGSAVVAGTALV